MLDVSKDWQIERKSSVVKTKLIVVLAGFVFLNFALYPSHGFVYNGKENTLIC
jgi:hypothetical protein